MKKLAIVLDSFSGLYSEDMTKKQDIYFLNLQIEIEDKLILEGIEKPTKEIINIIRSGERKMTTSQPSTSLIQDLMKKLNSEYQNIIFLPIPKNMSGTHDALLNCSKDYNNNIVINNRFAGDDYINIAEKALLMSKRGSSIEEIVSFIKNTNEQTIGYIIPDELTSIIKSGRLRGIKKHIISSGNLSIIIKVAEKMNISGIARSRNSAIKKVFNKLDKFCFENTNAKGYVYKIIYSFGDINLKLVEKYIKEKKIEIKNIMKSSLSVLIHTGYGAIYIGVSPKL